MNIHVQRNEMTASKHGATLFSRLHSTHDDWHQDQMYTKMQK